MCFCYYCIFLAPKYKIVKQKITNYEWEIFKKNNTLDLI